MLFKKFNCSRMSDKELYNQFNYNNWKHLNSNKRLKILQEVEHRESKLQGRVECKVKKLKETTYGKYDEETNNIYINTNKKVMDNDNPYRYLDTVYHEGRHAYQEKCINKLDSNTKNIIELENKQEKSKFYKNKKNIREERIFYTQKVSEIDANNYASKAILDNPYINKNDEKYKDFIIQKNKDYSQLNRYENESNKIIETQGKTIEILEKNQEITPEEANKYKKVVESGEQPVLDERYEVQEKLQHEADAIGVNKLLDHSKNEKIKFDYKNIEDHIIKEDYSESYEEEEEQKIKR